MLSAKKPRRQNEQNQKYDRYESMKVDRGKRKKVCAHARVTRK